MSNWDYTDRARTYDKRADYSPQALLDLLSALRLTAGDYVADIGAGTGKLTRPLLGAGLKVRAVEPNERMRQIGIENTKLWRDIEWFNGIAENTTLKSSTVAASFFGSSFNVVEPMLALKESRRICRKGGSVAVMWNHRDITDSLQARIEEFIRRKLPSFDYGIRRRDPTQTLINSGFLKKVEFIEESFTVMMSKHDVIEAWESHHTLAIQSAQRFREIIGGIAELIQDDQVVVPYTTRIWFGCMTID